MRYVIGILCVLALAVMGCSETTGTGGTAGDGGSGGAGGTGGVGGDGGTTGACADWAGEWANTTTSCDDELQDVPSIKYSFAADCTGEVVVDHPDSFTCERRTQLTFTRETGDTAVVDPGASTCGAGCTDECEPAADGGLPYSATPIVTDDTWTLTGVVTQQMVSDEITPCEAGQTMVSVAVRLVTDCTGTPDETPCWFNISAGGICIKEVCHLDPWDCEAFDVEFGDPCYIYIIGHGYGGPDPGFCAFSLEHGIGCALSCFELEEGAPCRGDFGSELGVCEASVCVFE